MAQIKLIEVKSDLGGRKPGASLGADAIRMVSYKTKKNWEYFYRFQDSNYDCVEADNKLYNSPENYHYSKKIELLIPLYQKTADSVEAGLRNNDFTIVISGDHSTAGATVAGMKQAFPYERIGVVWIDAHADVHTPYTTDTGNMHGMPMATMINDNNIECRFNEIDEKTEQLWEQLKSIGGTKDKIKFSDVVFVGLRDYEIAEEKLIKKHKATVIRTIDMRILGARETAVKIIKQLEHCDVIYVTFDVDSMDPSVSVGTGTPVEGGLFATEAKALLQSLANYEKVKCIEISEVNPILDSNNKTAEIAFNIFQSICRVIDFRVALATV